MVKDQKELIVVEGAQGAGKTTITDYLRYVVKHTNLYRLSGISDSTITKGIVQHTPGLSHVTSQLYNSYNEVYDICIKYDNQESKEQGDYEALNVLMKYEIITPNSVKKLTEKGKLKINNSEELVRKYSR